MTKENNKVDINKHEMDIDTLKKQNVNDLLSIKELYSKLEELGEKITQVKYIDNTLVKKIKKEYENLKKIILDENIQVQLDNKIDEFNIKLTNDIETINSQMGNKANLNSVFTMANMGQDVKEAMTGGSVAVVGVNTILTNNIVDGQVTAEKLSDVECNVSSNKIDTTKLSDGYITSNGLTGGASYKTTDYIEVKKGDIIRFYIDGGLGGNNTIRLYDSNKINLGGYNGSPDETNTYKTTEITLDNAKYMRYSFQTKNINVAMLTINKDYPNVFEDYYVNGYTFNNNYKLNDTQKAEVSGIVNSIAEENELNDKIISFIGDSICFGDGFAGGYGKIIAEKNKMIYENLGKSGSTIASGTKVASTGSNRGWICRRISEIRSDADYIILEGGVNDASLGVPLGEITIGYTATLDDTTFCGAFESILKQAIDRFPGKKIGFIITHRMSNAFETYYPKMIEMLNKWGIAYCDLYKTCPPLYFIPYLKTNYTKNGDGWHPNELGYMCYYVPKIETFIKSL